MDSVALLNYGVALFCLVTLGFAVWRTAVWVSQKFDQVVDPVVTAHIAFLDALAHQQAEGHDHALRVLAVVEKMLKNQNELLEAWRKATTSTPPPSAP